MTRQAMLLELLARGVFVRSVGVYDGLTAILAERAGFDALWAGGLCISVAGGVPDAGLLTMTEFHDAAVEIRRSSRLPIIADVDSGYGGSNVVRRMVQLYESAGIDAVCIEDKQYPKRNSFCGGNVLEDPDVFARKLEVAKQAQACDDFVVIARLESLIAGTGVGDVVARALRYASAGADALLIHSRASTVDEVAGACAAVRAAGVSLPIFAVPTTYAHSCCAELQSAGFQGAIFANQLMRAAVTAMEEVLSVLATTGSSAPVEATIAPVSRLFDLVGSHLLEDGAGMDIPSTVPAVSGSR